MVARAWLRALRSLAALTVGVLCALLVGCTPSPERVRPVAEALLLEALGEPYTVLAVKSEFNEGNGDPGRVRIWARSGADAELLLVFATSFRDGHLEITAERLRALDRDERASLDGSRAFIRAATPSIERFGVRARTTSSGELRVDLRLFEDVCVVGEGCIVLRGDQEVSAGDFGEAPGARGLGPTASTGAAVSIGAGLQRSSLRRATGRAGGRPWRS